MKKKTLNFLLVLFSLCFLTGCKDQNDTSDTTKVVLNEVAHSIFYAPMYVAIEEGYFAEENHAFVIVRSCVPLKTWVILRNGCHRVNGEQPCCPIEG